MRILHIDTGREMRGGQWQVLHLMEGLAERGVEGVLLAPEGSPLLQAAATAGLIAKALRTLAVARDSRGFDLIHAHDAKAHTLALPARTPVLVSRRVGYPVRRSLLSSWKYRKPIHYLAVSEFVKQELLAAAVAPDRISVVYDGVRLPGTAGEPGGWVVALDSDDPGKGKAVIERAARLANIEAHFSRQLETDFSKAGIFLYISELEGLGSAALLAMAHGVAVIASQVGGLPEIVKHGETGLLTTNQPEAIAGALRRLLDDPALARNLASRARSMVEGQFSIGHMVENTQRVYDESPVLIEAAIAGLFGLLIGSFLNVCIYRMPRDLSVVRPRSFCPSCEHMIAWYDNIPVLSYMLLRGRCRNCQAGIPIRYPVVEALTGALFFTAVWVFGVSLLALKFCVFSAILVELVFSDLEERILPDEFTIGGAIFGVAIATKVPLHGSFWQTILSGIHAKWIVSVVESAFAGLFSAFALWAIGALYAKVRHREGLGLGDVKMVGMIGCFLGLQGVLLTLIAGSTLGAVSGLLYIVLTKKDASTYELPMGTFLGTAAILAAYYGEMAFRWWGQLGS